MHIEFNQNEIEEIEKHISKYPDKKAALMPILYIAQAKWGWLSKEVMQYIADFMQLPFSHVEGVASFYTMYFKKPMGKYHIQVCTNVSCMLRNGEQIYKLAQEKLGIKHNETTPDGLFSLEEVECVGACGGAPVVVVNEDFYENFDINSFDEFLKKFS